MLACVYYQYTFASKTKRKKKTGQSPLKKMRVLFCVAHHCMFQCATQPPVKAKRRLFLAMITLAGAVVVTASPSRSFFANTRPAFSLSNADLQNLSERHMFERPTSFLILCNLR